MPVLALLAFACFLGDPSGQDDVGPDAFRMATDHGNWLTIQWRASNIVRVCYSADLSFTSSQSHVIVAQHGYTGFKRVFHAGYVSLKSPDIDVHVAVDGSVAFYDPHGKRVATEVPGARTFEEGVEQGESVHRVGQRWAPQPGESLYGMGQNQLGLVDIKGYDQDLWQHNTSIVVPFLASSKGYGILWDNLSYTRFGDRRPWRPVPPGLFRTRDGKAGALTFSARNRAGDTEKKADTTEVEIRPRQRGGTDVPGYRPANTDQFLTWEGSVVPPASGATLFQTYSNGGIKMWVAGKLVMNHWRQGWLPWKEIARVNLTKGNPIPIKVEWDRSHGGATELYLAWKPAPHDDSTSIWSEVGDAVDYTFVYGPSLDRVIAGYRQLTGPAKMLPKWVFGLWQSRQRYETQQASLDVVDGFRKRHIPFDNIVQDWFYWKPDGWGSHQFDPTRFPDPQGWIDAIHAKNAHLMISVWGKFYPTADNFATMNATGYLYRPNITQNLHDWVNHPYTFYDAFNPGARQMFWDQVNERLFSKHVDAWWMDATEPDLLPQPTLEGTKTNMNPTALGPASRVLNGYALFNSKGIYEGQRAAAPDQRVFILTRSGFAGIQRYSTASWSGDISSTWTAMKKQIAAGLSYSISGLPYWTMDTGGFSVPPRFASRNPKLADVDEWRELNARWFEFATFTPMLRVHGEFPYREMWEFGGEQSEAYKAELKFDRLRYELLPYVYSLAGDVVQRGGTMMRPLVMDFPSDATARKINHEFMFGPAFLVAPVTEYRARSRRVYLPPTKGGWYDYWTDSHLSGGGWITGDAPLGQMPLYVRAGSILPTGPALEYALQPSKEPLGIVIYPGAPGKFSLYEDDGLSNGYELGESSRIPLTWSENTREFTIGRRMGSFTGMPRQRSFLVSCVSPAKEARRLRIETGPITYSGSPASEFFHSGIFGAQ